MHSGEKPLFIFLVIQRYSLNSFCLWLAVEKSRGYKINRQVLSG